MQDQDHDSLNNLLAPEEPPVVPAGDPYTHKMVVEIALTDDVLRMTDGHIRFAIGLLEKIWNRKRDSHMEITEITEQMIIEAVERKRLREAGCMCEPPLVGHQALTKLPRCRLCNAQVT